MSLHNPRPINEINQITKLLSQLNSKVVRDSSLTYLSQDEYDQMIREVKYLSENLYTHSNISEISRDRLDELTGIMTNIANLDFSKRAFVNDIPRNHFDYVAIGLNLIIHQLSKNLNKLKHLKNVYLNDPIPTLITDESGVIQFVNKGFLTCIRYKIADINGCLVSDLLTEINAQTSNLSVNEIYADNGTCIGRIYKLDTPAQKLVSKVEQKVDHLSQSYLQQVQPLVKSLKTVLKKSKEKDDLLRQIKESLQNKGETTTLAEKYWLTKIIELEET